MITLEAKAEWSAKVTPVRAVLSEGLSRCYSLALDLFATAANLDPARVLNHGASVTLTVDGARRRETRKVTGIVTSLTLAGILPSGNAWYRLVLVPRLALLERTVRSRVFCTKEEKTVAGVVAEVLDTAEGVQISSADHVMRLQSQQYPRHDMLVQYAESDLAFVSRLAEKEGIFYFFRQGTKDEEVIFGDTNQVFPWVGESADRSALFYRPSVGIADPGPAVRSAALQTRVTPARIELDERYYGAPDVVLKVGASVAPAGVGLLSRVETEGYRDVAWGQALARIRAEEAASDRVILTGNSDCLSLGAGSVFTLAGHPAATLNVSYVVVSVEHHASESAAGIEYLPGPGPEGRGYRNDFTAIPLTTPFRPKRRTPWPRMPGLMRAVIDGIDTARSNIEALGCYRIKFPFDRRESGKGPLSCPVRLLTPYGGPHEGFHFPLRKHTQVMIAFHNGDPDRPVIVGPLYDALQKSVVAEKNRTANVISTVTGVTITLNDGSAPPSSKT